MSVKTLSRMASKPASAAAGRAETTKSNGRPLLATRSRPASRIHLLTRLRTTDFPTLRDTETPNRLGPALRASRAIESNRSDARSPRR